MEMEISKRVGRWGGRGCLGEDTFAASTGLSARTCGLRQSWVEFEWKEAKREINKCFWT